MTALLNLDQLLERFAAAFLLQEQRDGSFDGGDLLAQFAVCKRLSPLVRLISRMITLNQRVGVAVIQREDFQKPFIGAARPLIRGHIDAGVALIQLALLRGGRLGGRDGTALFVDRITLAHIRQTDNGLSVIGIAEFKSIGDKAGKTSRRQNGRDRAGHGALSLGQVGKRVQDSGRGDKSGRHHDQDGKDNMITVGKKQSKKALSGFAGRGDRLLARVIQQQKRGHPERGGGKMDVVKAAVRKKSRGHAGHGADGVGDVFLLWKEPENRQNGEQQQRHCADVGKEMLKQQKINIQKQKQILNMELESFLMLYRQI